MGLVSSKDNSETINWNNIKTENMSSTLPHFNGLSKEAKTLIASLNIPSITESETSEMNLNSILDKINTNLSQNDQTKFNQLLEHVSASASEDMSNTSPFISSEMYEQLVNSKTSETDDKQGKQTGGAKNKKQTKSKKSKKTKKGGALSDDSSDTTSTSSDSSLEDLIDSTEEELLEERKKNKNKNKKNKDKKKLESDSELSGGDLSYLSSSAHTEGMFSDSSEQNKHHNATTVVSSENQSSSDTQTSVSNENHGMLNTSISVNTEDINMVSDY
jgi:hypothetical protein